MEARAGRIAGMTKQVLLVMVVLLGGCALRNPPSVREAQTLLETIAAATQAECGVVPGPTELAALAAEGEPVRPAVVRFCTGYANLRSGQP